MKRLGESGTLESLNELVEQWRAKAKAFESTRGEDDADEADFGHAFGLREAADQLEAALKAAPPVRLQR